MNNITSNYVFVTDNLHVGSPNPMKELPEEYYDDPESFGYLFSFEIDQNKIPDDLKKVWVSGIIHIDAGMQTHDDYGKVYTTREEAVAYLAGLIFDYKEDLEDYLEDEQDLDNEFTENFVNAEYVRGAQFVYEGDELQDIYQDIAVLIEVDV